MVPPAQLQLDLKANTHQGLTFLPRPFTKLLPTYILTESLLQGEGKHLDTQGVMSQADPSFHIQGKNAQELKGS